MIGNHTYDHRYDELYGHFQDFWGQIKKTEEIIRLITGNGRSWSELPGTAGHFDEAYFQYMKQGDIMYSIGTSTAAIPGIGASRLRTS